MNPKEKFFSANRVSRCSQNNRQVIIVIETCLKNEKLEKVREKCKFSPFFDIFLNKKMRHIDKIVTTCYIKIKA